MELRDFISETLIQIVQGINDAQKALKETECVINPRNIEQGDYAKAIIKNKAHVVQDVSFNIALTSTSSDGNTSNTNISFSVPVVFPPVDNGNMQLPHIVIPHDRSYRY